MGYCLDGFQTGCPFPARSGRVLHFQPVVQVTKFHAVEFRHPRQVAPSLEAEFLQQAEAGLVAVDQDGDQGLDLERGAQLDGLSQ